MRSSSSAFAIAVPKGHPEALAYVTKFIEDAKASGSVRRAIDRAGWRTWLLHRRSVSEGRRAFLGDSEGRVSGTGDVPRVDPATLTIASVLITTQSRAGLTPNTVTGWLGSTAPMTNESAVSLEMPRRPVAKQVCCRGAIGTGGDGGGTAACGDSTNSHFGKVWPFSMCRSHFTSRAIAADSTNVNALAKSNLHITFFLVDRARVRRRTGVRSSSSPQNPR